MTYIIIKKERRGNYIIVLSFKMQKEKENRNIERKVNGNWNVTVLDVVRTKK